MQRACVSGMKEARIALSLTVRELLAESDRGMMGDVFFSLQFLSL